MQYGMEPIDSALDALPRSRFGEIVVRDFVTTSGLIILSPDDTYVNAPVTFDADLPAKYYLDFKDGFYVTKDGDDDIPVTVFPNSEYALENKRLRTGEPVRDLVMSHYDRIRISPITGCAFNCWFCGNSGLVYRPNPVEKLDKAFQIALHDPYMAKVYDTYQKHVLISGGTPRETLEDYNYMGDVINHFTSTYPDLKFDLMLPPRTLHSGEHTKRKYKNFRNRSRGQLISYMLFHCSKAKVVLEHEM